MRMPVVEIPVSFSLAVMTPRFMKLKLRRAVSPTKAARVMFAAFSPATDGAMSTAGAVEEFVTRPVGVEPSVAVTGPAFKKPWPMLAPIAMPEPLSGSMFSIVNVLVPRIEMAPLLM